MQSPMYTIAVMLGLCLFSMATGADRATPEQMRKVRGKHADLLADPATNYARIPALFLSGNPDECAKLRAEFETKLAQAGTDHERAVLCFLIAEAVCNEALYSRMQDRTAKPLEGWRKTVADRFLAAFSFAVASSDAKLAAHVAQQFFRRIPAVVATSPEGTKLAKRIVAEFVDRAEARPNIVVRQREQVAAYKALGIAQRLWADLPATPPEEQGALDNALRRAVSLGCEEKAVLYADVIWRRKDQSQQPASKRLFEATRVLLRTPGREGEMWSRLQQFEPKSKGTWLALYRLAPKVKPDLPRAERLAFLDRCLEEGAASRNLSRTLACHADVVRVLMVEKAYADALRYADLAIALPRAEHERNYPVLLISKGDCLARLGRTEEARKAYQKSTEPTALGHPSVVARIARDRLASLDATRGEE